MIQLTDKQIRILKIIFNAFFITVIVFQLLEKALKTLPNRWLLFLTSDAVEYFIFTSIAYFLYYYVLKLKLFWQKISFIISFIVIIVLLASLKSYRIYNDVIFERIFNFFTEFLGKTFLCYAFIDIVNRLDFLNRYKKLEKELDQAKEQLLKTQLHPHFLFNAFNSLYSMSLKNSPKTPDTILKLSGMMRYLTDDSINKQVKLVNEIKFIQEYIAIEKIRFGEQANINLQKEGNLENITVVPLLLITLVENAFKHGFYTNDSNAFVNINIKVINDTLLFKVENSIQEKQHFSINERKGKGIENLKRRLQISYPKTSKLLLQNKSNVYLAQLELKLL
ncbi:sensor histidine kinase [uncultured Lacinutrix sp.]|uniref:sensor histidine kinase n=1 Tax=uncultured Lacinutrix sp. TaxID=574032 RepID=UPI0026175194|nr:histidine kinase [uncultured Lacinutrix sp.]